MEGNFDEQAQTIKITLLGFQLGRYFLHYYNQTHILVSFLEINHITSVDNITYRIFSSVTFQYFIILREILVQRMKKYSLNFDQIRSTNSSKLSSPSYPQSTLPPRCNPLIKTLEFLQTSEKYQVMEKLTLHKG